MWPPRLPLYLRISATDWVEGGWNIEESVALAREVKELGVDLTTEADQAEEIIREGRADLVLMAREFLRRPQWPLHAALELETEPPMPRQYERGF